MCNQSDLLSAVPAELRSVLHRFRDAGHSAWLVGGAIRDHLLGLTPKDWDLATDASPHQVIQLFPRVIPVGIKHGTVLIHTAALDIEVTSYVSGAADREGLFHDLARRDFTINALAVSYPEGELLDPYQGQKDLRAKKLRAVGDPISRFGEDPLRTLRAARFVSACGLRITPATFSAMRAQASGLAGVALERIRNEMFKLLVGENVLEAFSLLRKAQILPLILPELLEGYRKKQNQFHQYDIYHHTLQTVHHSPPRIRVRLAALLHDIAKPRVRKRVAGVFRFYGHAKASARLASAITTRWKMSRHQIQENYILVANHLLTGLDQWSPAALRRLIARVGHDLLDDLLDLRQADLISHTHASSALQELERFRARIAAQVHHQPPLWIKDLAITGHDVMELLQLQPGPMVGNILRALRAQIIKHPEWNRRDVLIELLHKKWNG